MYGYILREVEHYTILLKPLCLDSPEEQYFSDHPSFGPGTSKAAITTKSPK